VGECFCWYRLTRVVPDKGKQLLLLLYNYYYYIRLMAFFQDNLGKLVPERYTILDFTGASDDGVAVASGGPYANRLRLAQDR